jgi:hypothetical protein
MLDRCLGGRLLDSGEQLCEQGREGRFIVPHFDLEMPADDRISTRLDWAGERLWDINEGLLPETVGWFVWNVVVGWADLCSADERRQYLALAANLQSALRKE